MPKESDAQRLVFEMIEMASFNNFDGPEAVRLLRENANLWRGVWMGRPLYSPLIVLRDLQGGYMNIDEMYILSSGEDDSKLELLAHKLRADEVDWLGKDEAGKLMGCYPPGGRVLRVWWD